MLLRLLIINVIFLYFTLNSTAQVLHFKVIHSSNLEGIAHVSVKNSNGVIYTDKNGEFSLSYKSHDTLTLTKENYHVIYYLIEAKNFDSSHTITLSMSAKLNSAEDTRSSINNLQKFEYHFVHDQDPDNNYIKIHALEHTPNVEARKENQPNFKIGSVLLEHSSGDNHSINNYSLKK